MKTILLLGFNLKTKDCNYLPTVKKILFSHAILLTTIIMTLSELNKTCQLFRDPLKHKIFSCSDRRSVGIRLTCRYNLEKITGGENY